MIHFNLEKCVMSKTIMIVDDDKGMRELLGLMLERHEFSVIKAADAEDALFMLQSSTPDLFLLDVMMPGMNGIELCAKIRQFPKTADTPIVFLSARTEVGDVQSALHLGANDYLFKPILVHDLVTVINRCLNLEYING